MSSNKKLSAVLTFGGAVAGTFTSSVGAVSSKLKDLGKEIGDMTRRQKLLGTAIQEFARAGKDVDGLRSKYAAVTAEINRQRTAFQRLQDAQKRADSLKATGGKVAKAGAIMTATGAAVMAPVVIGGREASKYQTEMARISALGLGDHVTKDAERFARALRTVGTSKLDNLTLVRDAMSVFGDLHHAELAAPIMAKMKFGNEAFYGAEHGAENETKFMDMLKVIELRGGTKSQADFARQANMVQKVLTATGGRVGPEEWRHLIATGGLAAKGMRDDAFFYQLEPLVQEMGGDRVGTGLMSAYSSLYQGHITKRAANNLDKFGLIADKSKVKMDKAGQVAFMDPGALKGADLFRQSQYEWLKQVLLPTLAAKGMTTKDQVLDAIGSIVSNRKGADVLGAMFLQSQQIDKNERMNRGAYGIDEIAAKGAETALGKQLIAEKKLEDLKLQMGQQVLPLYTAALQTAVDVLGKLNSLMENHPTLAKVMVVGISAIGAGLVALGPIVTVAGGILTAYAAVQLRLATQSAMAARAIAGETAAIEANNLAAAGGGAGGKLGKLGRFAGKATGAFVATELALGAAKMAGLPDVTDDTQKQGEQELRDGKWFRASFHMSAGSWLKGLFHGAPPPDVPDPAQRGGTTVNDNSQHTYNINQQPGQDAKALAEEIERERVRREAIRARSSMMDGLGGQ